ncbi:MAG: guanylate kinase [Fusobacteriaceae bacterium]|nr:guanylate kinase [Fusobacteriaceae bacterium]MBN2837275.1 guanylate kinase [Fusobacteriaceae bacterium]
MNKGILFVVSGPSGAGKSTVTKLVREELEIPLSISATTRKPRIGEVDGKDYYFLSIDEFEKKIAEEGFLEYANVHGNYYGTLKSEVESKLENGLDVILEIDVQGGEQIKEKFPQAILIFFKAPNDQELEKRLRDRNTDSEDVIKVRLENSLKELEYEKFYDLVIINDEIINAVNNLKNIINKKGRL